MKVKVNRKTCIGCGICPAVAPEVFYMDKENIACVKNDADSDKHKKSITESISSCPVDAIYLDEK